MSAIACEVTRLERESGFCVTNVRFVVAVLPVRAFLADVVVVLVFMVGTSE